MGTSQSTAVTGARVVRETVAFHGHPLVRSTHPTTVEITTEEHLTSNGDCIIGVGAQKGCAQLGEALKAGLRTYGSRVLIRVIAGPEVFALTARGDPRLDLSSPHDIVIRKSTFVSGRTLAVGATAAARDLPRSLVERLRAPDAQGRLEIEVA